MINGAYFWKLYARSLILPGFGQGFYNIKSFTGQQYNNIKNVDGYKQLYEKKSNVDNMLSENWTLFPMQQYYGIEQDGRVSDAIIRLETFLENKSTSMIIHVAGDFTVEELLQILSVEETKSIEFKSAE